MHAVTISKKRGYEFEGEQGVSGIWECLKREKEREGRKVCIL